MSVFCHEKLGYRFNVNKLSTLAKLPCHSLLRRIHVPDCRSILSFCWIWLCQPSPFQQNLLVRDYRWIELDKDSFRVVLHSLIGWIIFDASRVSHNAAQYPIHCLKLGLRPPKSPTCYNGNLMVASRNQSDFGTCIAAGEC
jgi:hypothetical protein